MEKIYSVLIKKDLLVRFDAFEKWAEKCKCTKFECQFDKDEDCYYGEYYFNTLHDMFMFKEAVSMVEKN